MSCHEENRRTPRTEDKEAQAGSTWPRHRKGDAYAHTLQRNKERFNIADLFDIVESVISDQVGAPLRRKVERVGVWHHITVNRQRTNYIGVGVAREFPGYMDIQIFDVAAELLGQEAIHSLQCRLEWQEGPAYYTRPGSDHAVYVNFLIPSLDYWNGHQQDFVKLAADINAAVRSR